MIGQPQANETNASKEVAFVRSVPLALPNDVNERTNESERIREVQRDDTPRQAGLDTLHLQVEIDAVRADLLGEPHEVL